MYKHKLKMINDIILVLFIIIIIYYYLNNIKNEYFYSPVTSTRNMSYDLRRDPYPPIPKQNFIWNNSSIYPSSYPNYGAAYPYLYKRNLYT